MDLRNLYNEHKGLLCLLSFPWERSIDRDDLESFKWEAIWKTAETYNGGHGKISTYIAILFNRLCGDKLRYINRERRQQKRDAFKREIVFEEKIDLECLRGEEKQIVQLFLEGYSKEEIGGILRGKKSKAAGMWVQARYKSALEKLREEFKCL